MKTTNTTNQAKREQLTERLDFLKEVIDHLEYVIYTKGRTTFKPELDHKRKERDEIVEQLKVIPVVGMGANRCGWSDIEPFEVVEIRTEKLIYIRKCDAKEGDWKPEVYEGGFAAHVANNHDQKWIVTSNEENPILKIRLNKNGKWQDRNKQVYRIEAKPEKFYDYNF